MAPWRRASPADGLGPGFALERCLSCGTAAIAADTESPGPPALDRVHTHDFRPPRLAGVVALVHAAEDCDRLRFVRRLPRGASILEVGAGDGRFLARLARAGFEVRGLEPESRRAARARARGLDVHEVAVEDAHLEESCQDAVVAWHILEHVEDPRGALARIRSWLRPGGELVLAVPNLASVQAQIGGDRWFHQDVPRHRTHFTERGIVALVRRSGFEVERVGHLLVEHNVLGMWQTLLNLLTAEPNVVYRLLKRGLRYRSRPEALRDLATMALVGPPLLLAAALLELVAGVAGRGGTIVLEARAS